MDSFTTTYLYDIISKCTQSELHQISLQQVKAAYGSIGLKPGSKRKEELIQDIIAYLTSILIKQCNGNQIREGFPLFNHNNELFQRNPHVKNLIEACNQQIHITNIQLAQLNYTRMNQAKRIITPPTNIYRCYCDQTIDPSYITDHVIKCINPKCGKLLHRFCMKLKNERDTYPLFECPECVLSKCDPLHQVLKVLVQPYVVDNRRRDFIIDDALYREVKMNESLAIEVRCIKLEDKSHEQCWPHNGELVLNQFKYLEFKPLQQNSSLKKRKDEKFVTTEVNCGNNSLWLKFVRGSDPRNPRAEETYITAVYLVRRLTCDELARKIKAENKRPVEECKKKIVDDFETSSVDIDKLVYPMTCVFDMQPLKTPAKGAHCKHSNCFSLENFINVWQKNNQRKWNCPICKLKSYDIIVDGYFEKIIDDLKKSGHDNPSQVEVEIMRNAEYKFVKTEDDTDSEDEQKVEAKPEKVQPEKSMNLIVLDDSDEEGGKRKAAAEASNKATEVQSKMIVENVGPGHVEHKAHEKKKEGAMQEEKEPTSISEQDQVLAKLKSNPVPSGLKDDKGLTGDQKKHTHFSPIQINSNEITPQKANPETEPKVIKHAPLPTDKEQVKSLEQKHREALQNKAQPIKTVTEHLQQQYEQQLAALARQQQQQHQQQQQAQRQQQERGKMPFVPNPQSHMQQHMATPQRQASQEKHQPQLQPQQQGPKQPPKPNDPAANLLNMNMQQNAALAKLMGGFRGPGAPNLTPQAMSALLPFLNMASKSGMRVGGTGGRPSFEELNNLLLQQDTPYKYGGNPELNALLMRSLDMAYRVNPNLLPQPNADLNMNILGMMNRPLPGNGATIHNSPNPNIQNQGTFLKESLTPKHPGSRIEGDNNNTLAPAEAPKMIPPEKDRMFEETEKHIEKMVDLAEYRVDLPTYETFKTKKNPEPKKMKETDYQKNKKLVSFIMKQLPLQSKGMTNNSLKLNNGPEAAGTTNINPMGNMQVETKTTGGMKIQGKEFDPICLD